jgi:hypothetical protein
VRRRYRYFIDAEEGCVIRRLSALICLLILLSGCGDGTGNPAGSPQSAESSVPDPTEEVRSLVLPLDEYIFSNSEYATTSNAIDLMVRDCMKMRGLTWEVIERPTRFPNTWNRRRYGVIEMQVAEQFGYHVIPALLGPKEASTMEGARSKRLTPDQARAANDPENGCSRKADDRLWAGAKPDLDLLNELSAKGLKQSQREPAVQKAVKAWRTCMRERGLRYQDPYGAIGDPAWSAVERPTRKEFATAKADVGCKDRSQLVKIWYTAEARIQRAAIDEHVGYFSRLQAAEDQYMDNARSVLADG